MREFFTKLSSGVKESEISSKNREILRILSQFNALILHKNNYFLDSTFIIGKLDINSNQTGFITAFDDRFDKDLMVESKFLNLANQGDIVLARLTKSSKSRQKAKVITILVVANEVSLVCTQKIKNTIIGINLKSGLQTTLKATQKSLKLLPPNSVLKIDNKSGEITEVLGVLDDPLIDEKISLTIYNKNSNFDQSCELMAKSFGNEVDKNLHKDRLDLTNLPFCTIDPVDAKDFDDAIYFDEKNQKLYVAIADVSEYVSPYSALDKEAKFRGFSIYFPHIAIPMLPRALSENICSLKPNCDRLAFTFIITLDENLAPVKEELVSAVIKSKKRFNYDEVDEILENKPNLGDLSWIYALFKLTQRLKSQRLQSGFDFETKELRLELDDEQNIIKTRFETGSNSHSLIEECMLLANKAAAKRIKTGIFRNHEKMDIKRLNSLVDELYTLGIDSVYETNIVKMVAKIQEKARNLGIKDEVDKLIIKAQKKAQYSPESRGHFGLGFDTYTHFTSPIRRYSDLILHRLLKANLQNDSKLFNYLLLNISQTCNSLNELEREADKVAFDFIDRKFARWANQNIDKIFKCYIDSNENLTTCKLDDELKGARIYLPNYFGEILTPVLVKIKTADIITGKIYGQVVRKNNV